MKALSPFGWLYGAGSSFRNALYDRGIFKTHQLGTRTISIGNLTAGGTGKTPLVAYVACILADSGEKVCILTRGYGRDDPAARVLVSDGETVTADARTGGDEPVELAQKLIGKAIVIADRDRVAAAKWAMHTFSPTVFVLDDGFQHRRVARDLDIVCVDATDPFGGESFLPAGRLREHPANLARAHAAVLTRADLADDLPGLERRIGRLAPNIEIFRASYELRCLAELGSHEVFDVGVLKDHPVFAFCGLGSPRGFFTLLEKEAFGLVGRKAFHDHHDFTLADINDIETSAQNSGAEILITTAKDAVRLTRAKPHMRCLVAEIDLQINEDGRFRQLIVSF